MRGEERDEIQVLDVERHKVTSLRCYCSYSQAYIVLGCLVAQIVSKGAGSEIEVIIDRG